MGKKTAVFTGGSKGVNLKCEVSFVQTVFKRFYLLDRKEWVLNTCSLSHVNLKI